MKSKEIRQLADEYIKQYPRWRLGQAIFNAAYELYPTEANKLRSTSVDCFHGDDLIDDFLTLIDKL